METERRPSGRRIGVYTVTTQWEQGSMQLGNSKQALPAAVLSFFVLVIADNL